MTEGAIWPMELPPWARSAVWLPVMDDIHGETTWGSEYIWNSGAGVAHSPKGEKP